jgi:hypothetical protein
MRVESKDTLSQALDSLTKGLRIPHERLFTTMTLTTTILVRVSRIFLGVTPFYST